MACEILSKDEPYGWASDGADYEYITWTKPMAHVQKVEVQFRDNQGGQHAQIADLEIYYCDSGSRVCQGGNFLRVTSSADSSLCGQNENEDAIDWAGAEIQVYFYPLMFSDLKQSQVHSMFNLFPKVYHNKAVIQTLPAGFTDKQICLDGIDYVNDQIELLNSNADGVSNIKYEPFKISHIIWVINY